MKAQSERNAAASLQNAVQASLLNSACEDGDVRALDELLQSGVADVNGPSRSGATPLVCAARANQIACARRLIEARANLDTACGPDRETALHVAVARGCAGTIGLLIKVKAMVDPIDLHGRSPLHIACIADQPKCVALLLASNADVNKQMIRINPGATPLYAAAFGGSYECTALLCEARASVNLRTEDAKTPMLACCQEGYLKIAMLLSSYGADRDSCFCTNQNGSFSEQLARQFGHHRLLSWLQASRTFCSPLQHIEVLSARRTIALLRSGASSPIDGMPSAALLASKYSGPAATVILRAAQPWSPHTHVLWAKRQRARATSLVKLGYLLAKSLNISSAQSFLDAWLWHVMPQAVTWEPAIRAHDAQMCGDTDEEPEAYSETLTQRINQALS